MALSLVLLTFSQSSGSEAADTKLDLVVTPIRFLRNALSMWDPTAAAGQLQDQAYGYLFPMGPFFALGKWSALSPWVVQRAWESALLIVALLGVVRLSRLLGVRGFWPRVGAGLAYALAPRMLMELGVISSELLPVAVLPWVVIPLVRGSEHGSPRRAAAASGLAFLFAGGINASATLAILPVPALWLLTRARGPRRRALMSWWVLAVALASLWWALPLALLGRFSPPFLDWIESSTVTTSTTGLVRGLRGVDHWQGFLGPNVWPSGWILAVAPAAVLATALVAAMGVAGLGRRAVPHRLFLLSVLAIGLVLLTLGHVATFGPPFAGTVRHMLDGALAAFRNVHKFDPVVRLPLAIGFGHALAALPARVPRHVDLRLRRTTFGLFPRTLAALAVLAIGATAITPALAGRIVPQTRITNDPSWWKQTGTWLGRHAEGGRALVLPGAAQPAYIWGAPRDDALQPVAGAPWTVRDATPLTQPGYVRLLDRIEALVASGQGDPTLGDLLARSGIRYLVVRNDLDTNVSRATPLRFVHATIANSPHLTRAAAFGPRLGPADDPNRLVDLGLTREPRAVEVYENTAWHSAVSLLPAAGAVVTNGSSDQLPQLVAAGIGRATPVIFGAGPPTASKAMAPTRSVLTEGIRRREFGFGGVDRYSATMTVREPFGARRAAHDYLPGTDPVLSTVQYTDVSNVQVSSAASAAQSGWSALDGLPGSAWVSSSLGGAVGQWIEVELPQAINAESVLLGFAARRSTYPSALRVTTDAGSVVDDVSPDSGVQPVALPAGHTRRIRITVAGMARDVPGAPVAISTLVIPGVLPSRTLAVPGTTQPTEIDFAVLPGARPACLTVGGVAACDPSWALTGDEDDALDRTFQLTDAAAFRTDVGVYLQPGPQLDNLLDRGNALRVLASSVDSSDPRERAGAAVDGDPATGWVAKAGDKLPSLEISTARRHRLDGIQVLPIAGGPAAAPTRVQVTIGDVAFEADVPPDGRISFGRSLTAKTVRITAVAASLRLTTDSSTRDRRLLPVGIGEIRLLGPDAPVGTTDSTVHVACGDGPTLLVNGGAVDVGIDAAAKDVLAGRPVAGKPCADGLVALQRGLNRIRLGADASIRPAYLRMIADSTPATPATTSAGHLDVQNWGKTNRDVRVSTTRAAFLSVAENANAAWTATLQGRTLTPVTLDGWHQGWLLPAGANGVVHLEFVPQRQFEWALAAGVIAVVVLLALALVGGRRSSLPSARAAVLGRRAALATAGAGVVLIGGLAGLVVLAAVLLVRRSAPRVRRLVPWAPVGGAAVWAAGALTLAGLAEAVAPANSAHPLADSGVVQLLCLLAIALLFTQVLPLTTPRAAEASEHRPLEEVEGKSGDDRRARGGQQQQLEEVAAKHGPTHPVLDEDQQR